MCCIFGIIIIIIIIITIIIIIIIIIIIALYQLSLGNDPVTRLQIVP